MNVARKQWEIRDALVNDADNIRSCMHSAYASYQDRMGGKRLPPMELDYASEIAEFPTWVAEFDDNIAGALTMTFEKNLATIANIAVHPEFQGQGLGGRLMKLAENQAKERRCSEMRLATHVLLVENVSLYVHLGWVEYDRDDTRVHMKKTVVS